MDNNDNTTKHKTIHLEPTVYSRIILEFLQAHSYFPKETIFKLGSKKIKRDAVNSTTNALLKELVSCCFLQHVFGYATTGFVLFDCCNKLADALHAALYCKCGVEFHDATNSKVPTDAKVVQTFLQNLVNQQAKKYRTGNCRGSRIHPGLFDRPAWMMSSWPTVHQPTTASFCHALPNHHHGNYAPLTSHNSAMIPQSISMMPCNMPSYASQHMPSSSTNDYHHHHQLQHMHQTNPQSAIADNNNDNNQYCQEYRQHSMQYPAGQSATHQEQTGHGNGCSIAAMTQAESVAVSSSEHVQVDIGPSSPLQPLPFGENVETDDNDVAAIVSLIRNFAICNEEEEEEEENEKKYNFDDMSIDFYADCNSVGRLDSSFRSRRSSGRSTRRSSRRFSSDSLLSDAFTITQEALVDSSMMTYFESAKFEQDCELYT